MTKKIYEIDFVLSKVNDLKRTADKVNFNGDMIHMNSQRYHLFKERGTVCVACGLKGQYFVKEKTRKDYPYHFNLYGIDENNEEMMLTKDHVMPKSKGGSNHISNYQTMCKKCNGEKADKV